ncbi:MAG: dockerin type I repeat-containing protein [Ruminococcus sp.]
MKLKKLISGLIGVSLLAVSFTTPFNYENCLSIPYTANAVNISDLPSDYQYACDWIWENRIMGEKSVEAYDTILDQIVAGNGTLNYVVKWHSYKTITLQQRKNIEKVLEKAINDWTDWLKDYDSWPFEHVNVKIVGWAVIDKNSLLDLQEDEVVYTDTLVYDNSYDINSGMGSSDIPSIEPAIPSELFRYDHWADKNYVYPGGYENRIDMYLQATQGFVDVGGYGYYWGQQLSDNSVISMSEGTSSIHVLEHEIGHGLGMTDFYGGEGESDGFPPGGFPGNGTSIMMAGSSAEITDFDGWFIRYMWTKIKDEPQRFDLSVSEPTTTETTTTTTTTTTETTTVTTTTEPVVIPPDSIEFTKTDDNKWTFNANNAQYAELTFKGTQGGGIAGNLNGIAWDTQQMSDDTVTVKVELPENTYESVIERTFSGIWSNEIGDMIDMSSELLSIKLYYREESDTTVWGDANCDNSIDIADVVAVASYVSDSQKNALSGQGIINADVHANGDGISANDALAIQQYLANTITALPV